MGDACQVGGKYVEIQPRARVCKVLEIADTDDVGHSLPSCPTRAAVRPLDIFVYNARSRTRVASGGYWRWVAAWLWQQRHGQHEHQSEQAGGKERKHEPEAERRILCRPRP